MCGFGANKYNELVKKMLDDYKDVHFVNLNGEFDLTTCVIRNSKVLEKTFLNKINDKTKVSVIDGNTYYPKEYFSPKDYETGEIVLTENTCTIHHFSGSWHTEEEKKKNEKYKKRLNKYVQKYGEEKGKIKLNQVELVKYYLCHPIKACKKIVQKLGEKKA
ncbi:MAG: hypothetical protein J6K45_03930 [Clostridia bacterium]|nr:hypothetical protein [Clostridia bacterium]